MNATIKPQGRAMNTQTPISFVLSVVAAWVTFGTTPACSAVAGEGKFHLVYLVAAVDLKPGARVTVDPIFFTDGREVKNFHDYCQTRDQFLKPTQINEDTSVINSYCNKTTFMYSLKNYVTFNNHGEQIKLGDVEFKVKGVSGINNEPVMMGYSEVSSFAAGTIVPPRLLRGDGAPEYFFLMSKDKTVLKQIVPVSKVTEAELRPLVEKAFQVAEKVKGTAAFTQALDISKIADTKKIKNLPQQTSIENPIFVDINNDALIDVAVGVRATYQHDRKADDWVGVIYVLSPDKEVLGRWALFPGVRNVKGEDRGVYQEYLRNNFPVTTPLGVIRIGGCTYVLRYLYDVSMDVPSGLLMESRGISMPRPNCTDRTLVKIFGSP
jgi:hypothetical protein